MSKSTASAVLGLFLCAFFVFSGCQSSRSFVKQALREKAHTKGFHHAPHKIANIEVGIHALLERVYLIRNAKKSIDVQYYLIHNDQSGKLFSAELVAAAQRGVEVRVIVDQMLLGLDHKHAAAVLNTFPNFKIKVYNPVGKALDSGTLDILSVALFEFNRVNQRMHNKLLLVDDEVAICGGRNIGNEYFDLQRGLNFRDRDIVLSGPVCADLKASFDAYWQHQVCVDITSFLSMQQLMNKQPSLPSTDKLGISQLIKTIDGLLISIDYPRFRSQHWHEVEAVAAWIDAPGKFVKDKKILHAGHSLAALQMQTQTELCFQSPYLVLSDRALYIFKKLKKRGSRVMVSTNSLAATDSWPTYAYLHRQKKLMVSKLKMHISEFKPFPKDLKFFMPNYDELRSLMYPQKDIPARASRGRDPYLCVHAKGFTVDHDYSVIGSYNMDPRSQDYNTELMIVIKDQPFTRHYQQIIKRDAHPDNSWIVARRDRTCLGNFMNGIFGTANDILRQLTSLDVWPIRYASCFELIEGKAAVPIDHPDFYNNYTHVGLFPEVGTLEGKNFLSRITKMLGGVLHPIL